MTLSPSASTLPWASRTARLHAALRCRTGRSAPFMGAFRADPEIADPDRHAPGLRSGIPWCRPCKSLILHAGEAHPRFASG